MGTVRGTVKRKARAALKGRWGTAVLITLTRLAASLAVSLLESALLLLLNTPSYLENLAMSPDLWQTARSCAPWYLLFTALNGLAALILFAPLSIGTADWYMGCTHGENRGLFYIFWPFGCKKFWGSLVLYALRYLAQWFWSVLFLCLPVAGLGWSLYSLYYLNLDPAARALAITGALAAVLFLLAMLFLLTVFLTRYSLCPYLMGRRYAKGPFGAMAMSVRLTKGHLFEAYWFSLSLLPWKLLSCLALPAFYAAPYISASYALYTRYLAGLYEAKSSAGKAADEKASGGLAAREDTENTASV